MSKSNPQNEDLEYYTAKKAAGQYDTSLIEDKKKTKSKPVKPLQDDASGYVTMKTVDEKTKDFERFQEITFAQKASDKAKQNPMIPIGMLATIAALTLGLRAVSRGDKWQSQMMMRARIGAQGFTIFAVLASIMYAGQTTRHTLTTPTPAPVKTRPSTDTSS